MLLVQNRREKGKELYECRRRNRKRAATFEPKDHWIPVVGLSATPGYGITGPRDLQKRKQARAGSVNISYVKLINKYWIE